MRVAALVAAGLTSLSLAAVASAASPPKAPPANAFQTCLKKHGVTLGKTTDQKKIRTAFVACRAVAPGGAGQRALTPAQRAAVAKYTACLAKHGVKLTFTVGQRPTAGQRPVVRPAKPASAKLKAAQKACAALRPRLPGGPPGVRAGA